MKFYRCISLSLLALLFMGAINPGKNNCNLINNYQVTIAGTSNLHSWSEIVETVTGEGIININNDNSYNLESFTIKMNVNSFKSDMGSVMNHNTFKALKGDANPQVIFLLNVPVKSIQSKTGVTTISVKGNLTIAGTTRFVDIPVMISRPESDKFFIQGTYPLKMPDYGVSPPTALFGTLTTGSEVRINFKLNFTSTPLTYKN